MKIRMIKLGFVLLCVTFWFGVWSAVDYVMPSHAEVLDSYNIAWKLVRDTAIEDGTNLAAVYALDSNEGNWASRDTTASFRLLSGPASLTGPAGQPDSPGAVWKFVFSGGPTENDTLSFDVIGWAQGNGMAQVICTGDADLGTQDVVYYPDDNAAAVAIWWFDTINLDATDTWAGVNTYNSDRDSVAELLIDTTGLEYLQFIIYDADGTGTEANDVTVFGRPY